MFGIFHVFNQLNLKVINFDGCNAVFFYLDPREGGDDTMVV